MKIKFFILFLIILSMGVILVDNVFAVSPIDSRTNSGTNFGTNVDCTLKEDPQIDRYYEYGSELEISILNPDPNICTYEIQIYDSAKKYEGEFELKLISTMSGIFDQQDWPHGEYFILLKSMNDGKFYGYYPFTILDWKLSKTLTPKTSVTSTLMLDIVKSIDCTLKEDPQFDRYYEYGSELEISILNPDPNICTYEIQIYDSAKKYEGEFELKLISTMSGIFDQQDWPHGEYFILLKSMNDGKSSGYYPLTIKNIVPSVAVEDFETYDDSWGTIRVKFNPAITDTKEKFVESSTFSTASIEESMDCTLKYKPQFDRSVNDQFPSLQINFNNPNPDTCAYTVEFYDSAKNYVGTAGVKLISNFSDFAVAFDQQWPDGEYFILVRSITDGTTDGYQPLTIDHDDTWPWWIYVALFLIFVVSPAWRFVSYMNKRKKVTETETETETETSPRPGLNEVERILTFNDPYNILGIPRNSSQGKIKKSYQKLVIKYDPSFGMLNRTEAEQKKVEKIAIKLHWSWKQLKEK